MSLCNQPPIPLFHQTRCWWCAGSEITICEYVNGQRNQESGAPGELQALEHERCGRHGGLLLVNGPRPQHLLSRPCTSGRSNERVKTTQTRRLEGTGYCFWTNVESALSWNRSVWPGTRIIYGQAKNRFETGPGSGPVLEPRWWKRGRL